MFKFYDNESLRKLVIAFGSLFNEIYVSRTNSRGVESQRLRVPLTYGSKEKFIRKLDEQSGISDKSKVEVTLPRLSFEMSSILLLHFKKFHTIFHFLYLHLVELWMIIYKY